MTSAKTPFQVSPRGAGVFAVFAVAALALAAMPLTAQTAAEDLRLTVGKSVVIDYPSDIRQISTSNPEILDASPVTTREILLHGKGLGAATMVVWSKSGQRTFYNVNVELNLEPLRKILKDSFPNETLRVYSSRESISLSGRVSSKEVAERAVAMAQSFSKVVVNNLQLAPAAVDKQILLRVKFAELDRNVASDYGVNLVSTGATNTIGRTTTGQYSPPSATSIGGGSGSNSNNFTITDALNIFAFRPDLNLGAFIKALQAKGVLQILAEPNLVTSNGKEANFLVGGEFPIPVLQGGSNSGAVTIQFREFGIRLKFTPQITENNTIKLQLRQEVSTIDIANGVSLNGFRIPALSTRKAETDIELTEGQSFIVAGLVDNRETESYSKIPGLGSIPIFGALFKSRSDNRSRSELVVMVTPEFTTPLGPNDPKPIPYMPNEFLVPITPPGSKVPVADAKSHRSGGRKHN
ncbi:MAG: type II and III secretion system protein family protein [Bryobacteraceae bacterium]